MPREEHTTLEGVPAACSFRVTPVDGRVEPPAVADGPPACFNFGFIHVDAVATALVSAGAVCT